MSSRVPSMPIDDDHLAHAIDRAWGADDEARPDRVGPQPAVCAFGPDLAMDHVVHISHELNNDSFESKITPDTIT